MAPWFKTSPVPQEDPSLAPRTHRQAHRCLHLRLQGILRSLLTSIGTALMCACDVYMASLKINSKGWACKHPGLQGKHGVSLNMLDGPLAKLVSSRFSKRLSRKLQCGPIEENKVSSVDL